MRANNVTDNIIKASDGTGDEYCSLDCLFCVLRVDHVRAGPGLKFSAIPPCPMGRVLQGVTPLPGDTVPEARQALSAIRHHGEGAASSRWRVYLA